MRLFSLLPALLLTLAALPAVAAKKKAPPPPPVEVAPVEAEPEPEPAIAEPPPPAPALAVTEGLPGATRGSATVFAAPRAPKDREKAEALEAQLLSELRSKGMSLVDLEAAFPPSPPRSVKPGDTLIAEGKAAYENLDLDGAKAKFVEARKFFVEHAFETPPQKLASVYVFIGAISLLLNDAEAAKEAFRDAAALAPDVPPDSELFAPEVVDAYGAAWEWVAQQKPGTLEIDSEPPGATVTIAGEKVGVTPVTVQRGYGWVRAELARPGYEPTAVYAELKSAGMAKTLATLTPAPGLIATRELAETLTTEASFADGGISEEARAVGERLSARYLVLAAVDESDGEVQAWDLTASTKLTGLKLEGESVPEIARKIDAWTRGEYSPPEKRELFANLPDVMKRPWFWAAVGGAAAATAGAVWVGSSSGGGRPFNVVTGIP